MKSGEALRVIASAARGGRVEFSEHALVDSMPDDGCSWRMCSTCCPPGGRHARGRVREQVKIHGHIVSGEAYVVVARIRGDDIVIVVTCHPPP